MPEDRSVEYFWKIEDLRERGSSLSSEGLRRLGYGAEIFCGRCFSWSAPALGFATLCYDYEFIFYFGYYNNFVFVTLSQARLNFKILLSLHFEF